MNKNTEFFLDLVRLGLAHTKICDLPSCIDWDRIEALAAQHGLSAVVLDGVEKLPEWARPPQILLLKWIGEVLQKYEGRFGKYKKAIGSLSSFYNQHGYKMMVLKGYAVSLDWPKPEHRSCGDIDIWLFGKQKEADLDLANETGLEIDGNHHHHTVFGWHDFTVENHYDFINVNRHKSHFGLEQIFKELGADDSHYVELFGEKVYLPSPNLHALFLLRHALNHFASIGINLRQVLDWAFFIDNHTKEIDWDWLLSIIYEYRMREFFNCLNAICVEDLGFNDKIFPYVQYLPELKQRVLNDILEPEYGTTEPIELIRRIVYKYRRWQGNAWKQDLCYVESRWSSLWSGIWAKLLKPASI